MAKQESKTVTKEQFIALNCCDCKHDNEDSEPTCNILKKILDGIELKSLVCKKYKKRSWRND